MGAPQDKKEQRMEEQPNIEGDKVNITLLIFMYMIQGVVDGLNQAYPIIFQKRNVSFKDQAEFSISAYPFAMKVLWAPIVDCVYSKKFGRRKTWLIPTQYLMGIILLFVSINLDDWLGGDGEGAQKPNIRLLTVICFAATFFNATQDVALDGWSLTMLQRRNIGYAGTCQTIGSTTGHFLAYVLFIILDSKDFCNKFRSVPLDHGFVSLANFVFFWSMVILVSTTLILLFKKDDSLEKIEDDAGECRLGLKESYKMLGKILRIRPIIMICLIQLTCRIGFGPIRGVASLKVLEAGVSQENFVLLNIPALPFQILLSVVLRHYLTGPRGLTSFVVFYTLKLIVGVLLAIIIFSSSRVKDENEKLPIWFYILLLCAFNIRAVFRYLMSTALIAYISRVSDARFGGIYFTIVVTMANVGSSWPTTLCLWLVDALTWKSCDEINTLQTCYAKVDGFYVETAIFTLLGALWLRWGTRTVQKLENLDASAWMVRSRGAEIVEDEKLPELSVSTR